MTDLHHVAKRESEGMLRADRCMTQPWEILLKPPHPAVVSVAAGALATIASSRDQAYMIAYLLHEIGLIHSDAQQLHAELLEAEAHLENALRDLETSRGLARLYLRQVMAARMAGWSEESKAAEEDTNA